MGDPRFAPNWNWRWNWCDGPRFSSNTSKPLWVVADGAYAKADVLKPLSELGVTVVSRLRHDSALRTLPQPRTGQRGRPRIYGEHRIELAKRAGQRRGWVRTTLNLYGKSQVKRYKTFLATWSCRRSDSSGAGGCTNRGWRSSART